MKDIVTTETRAIEATPESILQRAIDAKLEPASMEKFYALYQQMKADQARAAFAQAFSRFKSICPPVPRATPNPQFKVERNGVRRDRMFASLEDIERTVRDPLGECGLSYRWTDAKIADGMLALSCEVAHTAGHSVESTVFLPVDSKAGCSEQQKFGIVMSYAQRYSLIQALGLTSCDVDEDGNMPGDAGDTISEEQASNLELAVENVSGDVKKFLAALGVEKFTLIPLSKYGKALELIERKRGGK